MPDDNRNSTYFKPHQQTWSQFARAGRCQRFAVKMVLHCWFARQPSCSEQTAADSAPVSVIFKSTLNNSIHKLHIKIWTQVSWS